MCKLYGMEVATDTDRVKSEKVNHKEGVSYTVT